MSNLTVERQIETRLTATEALINKLEVELEKAHKQRLKLHELRENLDNIEAKLKRV